MWFRIRTLGDKLWQTWAVSWHILFISYTYCHSLTSCGHSEHSKLVKLCSSLHVFGSVATVWYICLNITKGLMFWLQNGSFLVPSKTLQKNTTPSARGKVLNGGLQTAAAVGQFELSEPSVSVPESLSDALVDLVEALKRVSNFAVSWWSTEPFMTLNAIQSTRANQDHPIIEDTVPDTGITFAPWIIWKIVSPDVPPFICPQPAWAPSTTL